MKEVSCKVLTICFKELEGKNLSPEILCNDIPYDLNYLRNEKLNIEWEVFCKIMLNTRTIWNNDDYIELGIKLVKGKLPPVFSAMIGLFMNTKEMYRLITSTRKGIGTQYFRCITATYSVIDRYHIEILLELPAGYQYSKEFFLVTKGFFIAAPGLLKHNHSSINMIETNRGARYQISLPQGNKPLTWFRQLLSFTSSKRAGIKELNETYSLLYERYIQLEEKQAIIEKQAKQLETANRISNLIRSNLDLNSTLKAVAEALINQAGFAAVEIKIDTKMDHEQVNRVVQLGDLAEKANPLKRVLEIYGKYIGELNLWMHPGSPNDDLLQLLDIIISTITMEIMNSLSFKLVKDYRNKLESKVDEIQNAILEERRRISSELHDDLGTNLSAIALMSGVMKKNIPGDNLEKICVTAQLSLNKINEIVWSLNPKNDNLDNLIAYIRKYAVEYFEPTPIKCIVNLPKEIPDILVIGEHRRNFFYTIKEALHNIIKHAEATEAELRFAIDQNTLSVVIKDNGKGVHDEELNRFGNGLFNMQNRMQSINGDFIIESKEGTKIVLTLPV